MKTTITIEVTHHPAVDVREKFIPVATALLDQMYSVTDYSFGKEGER